MPEADRLDALAVVDGQVLGMRRDIDHAWFGERGTGWLLEHAGRPVGYAYTGRQQGPIAVLDPSLVPGAIGLLETAARERGDTELSLWVPLVNTTAVEYLLGRGYRLDPDPLYLLERPVVIAADRYVITSPPFFL